MFEKDQILDGLDKTSFLKLLHYPKNYPKYLPKRNSFKYTNIEMFEDYEFTNCIAFEMLIRTKEYKELMNIPNNKFDDEWKVKIQKLGLNFSDAISIKADSSPFRYLSVKPLISQDYSSISISNIDKGLELLIEFYIKKNKIFTLKSEKEDDFFPITTKEYQIEEQLTLKQVLENLDNYYIPVIPYSSNLQTENKCKLHKNIQLFCLEKEFLQTIENKISKIKNIKFLPFLKRPLLRFEESRILELEINLDLPKEELIKYIEKIKDEYDNDHSIAKNINDIFNNFNDNPNHNSSTIFKKNIADAFFCYDYYNAKKDFINEKNEKNERLNNENPILIEKEEELKRLKENARTPIELINSLKKEIKEEKIKLNKLPSINKKSKNYVFEEKYFTKSNINANTAYNYYHNLYPYIDHLKYKELIIGKR